MMDTKQIQSIVEAVVKELHNNNTQSQTVQNTATTPNVETDSLPDLGDKSVKKYNGVDDANNPDIIKEFLGATNTRVATGHEGPRPKMIPYLRFLADHARSKGSVIREVSEEWLQKNNLWSVQTQAESKDVYLTRPDLGRKLPDEAIQTIKSKITSAPQVQVILSDGLSTDALLANYEDILPPLLNGLKSKGYSVGEPFFLRYGRVKAQDVIGHAIGAEVVILLIGERPGLGQSESMSCYAVYKPDPNVTVESDRTVISNIHAGGTPPVEAAAVIVDLASQMLKYQASGIELNKKSKS